MVAKLDDIRNAVFQASRERSKSLTVHSILGHYLDFKETLSGMTRDELVAREAVIRDTALLFSLAFVTIGYALVPIALYAKGTSLHSMLDLSVGEPSITPKEEAMITFTLTTMTQSELHNTVADIPDIEYINELVDLDVSTAKKELGIVQKQLHAVPEPEQPLFVQITHMRRDILAAAVSMDRETAQLKFKDLSEKLEVIKTHIEQGNDGEIELSATTAAQLKNAGTFLDWFKNGISMDEVRENLPNLSEEYEKLQKILPALNMFVLTKNWTLRCTDLYPYVSELVKIQPKVLKFLDTRTPSKLVPTDFAEFKMTKYEYILKYMVRRAWVEVYKLLDSTEPVSEALSSIYNQLLTLKRCLIEVQNAGGISSMRELYPFQMKLSSLDDMRQDGKFVVDGEIPAGQGVVIGLLTECFDMVYELKIELDEKGEEDNDESLLVDDGDEDFSEDDRQHSTDDQESTYASSIASSSVASLHQLTRSPPR